MELEQYFYLATTSGTSYGYWDINSAEPDLTNYPAELKKLANYVFLKKLKHTITEQRFLIGYYKKFNALHGLILNNFAERHTKETILTEDDLVEILDTCNKTLAAPEKAAELFPTYPCIAGGNLNYDTQYFHDVNELADFINVVLEVVDFDKYTLIYTTKIKTLFTK